MVRLGFIGCGGIATHHASTIQSNVQGISISAGADVNEKTLTGFGESFGCSALFRDYRKMIASDLVDAVCVALPTHLHKAAVMTAAKAGIHVFCEKPMARTLSDCDAMIEACDRAGVVLMIGHVRRYDADWGTWRKVVDGGALGRPVIWRQTQGTSAPGSWYMEDKMGGGPFLDGCVHNWDFANLVFGQADCAYGSFLKLSGASAFDTGTATVRYKSGDQVVLNWSWGLPKGIRAAGAHDILGPSGMLQFPGHYSTDHVPQGLDSETHGAYLVSVGKRKRVAKFKKKNMFAEEWKDFRSAVSRGTAPLATGHIGRSAVEVALAVLKSGKTGKAVRIGGGK